MKNLKIILVIILSLISIVTCMEADIASRNLSKKADRFEISRRIVFYNGITDTYMLVIEGKCAIHPTDTVITVTCKTGSEEYKKHYLGLSDNVTYFAEQLESVNVDVYHYDVVFKPSVIIPDISIK